MAYPSLAGAMRRTRGCRLSDGRLSREIKCQKQQLCELTNDL